MYLLDTDILSEFFRRDGGDPGFVQRVRRSPSGTVFISTITIAEVMQGALALVRRLERTSQEDQGYALLERTFQSLHRFPVSTYDAEAHRIFLTFAPVIRRQGRADCQIAATAIRHGLVVVTRNTRHFGNIPGVQHEDWLLSDAPADPGDS